MQFSIVKFQEIKNAGFRTDAEYWHPEFIKNADLVSTKTKIKDVVIPNIPNIKSLPINRDFDYLEISNISTNSCEYQTVPVKRGEEPDRAHYILKKKDIVVSTVRPNRNAVAFVEEDGIIGSSGLSVLRAKDIEPEYLFAFCKTDYFVKCLIRASKASMYPAVATNDILDTSLFVPSPQFRETITEFVKNSLLYIHASHEIYDMTQDLLISELGLDSWQPMHKLSFIKNFSETQKFERIDAEYFQPKYEEMIAIISDYPGGWNRLGNLVLLKDEDFKPEDNVEYKYIELSHIAENGEIIDCIVDRGQDLPTRARRKVSVGNVIVSSIEGSLSSIALVDEKYNDTLCSTGFHVVNSHILNSETLLVLLKSIVGQLQLKKGCNGTILTAISKDEFGKIVLPTLPQKMQTEIQQMVTESFNLRQQSKTLLHRAKRAVEIAIEQGEQTAIEWLESEDS